MTHDNISTVRKFLLKWASENLREFPWRKKRVSRYEIFVAEMLLKRTTAKAASTVYYKFLKKYPDIVKLANSNERGVMEILNPIGYPQRASEVKKAARHVVKFFKSKIPGNQASLLEVPFIGDYTSSAILSLSCNKPFPMIDSNVNRIINRMYFGQNPPSGNINKVVMRIANKLLPNDQHRIFNLAMLDLGGTICLPKRPNCSICPLQKICKFRKSYVQ